MQSFSPTISKKKLIAFTACIILAGALGVSAYVVPQAGPTDKNTRGPIDISTQDQLKDGGLGVNAFQSRGNALFLQNASFKGPIHGGLPTDTTSTLKVATDATVTGTIRAKNFLNATTISHPGDATEAPLCANDAGAIVTCESLANTGGGGSGGAGGSSTATLVAAADAQPGYSGGVIGNSPDSVLCTASLDNPAGTGGVTVDVQYSYQDDTGMTVMNTCPTITIPEGMRGSSSTAPESFGNSNPIINACVLDASIAIDPSIHC